MTIEEIKDLIRVVHETGIAELEVQRGEDRVRIRSAMAIPAEPVFTTPTAVPAGTAAPVIPGALSGATTNVHQLPASTDDDRNEIIKSPIVGTYYDSPAPGSEPFVKIGDRVEPKQVLCIIESMKLMNEIEADVAGEVVKRLVNNGQPIEYGQELFQIRAKK